jgi:hypothetical protein
LQPPYIERPNEEAQQIDIAEGASEALFPLIATPDAPADRWPLTVLGRSETADGVVWASSDFIMLTVAEPNVSLAIRPAETEAGQPVEMICELQTLVPFDGPATLKLAGLPKGTTAPERTVDQTTREVTFPVSVTDATPIGIHNAVYCELTIVRDGEPSTQFVGRGGVLDVRARGTPAREKRSRLTVLRQEREAKSRADAARSRAGQ